MELFLINLEIGVCSLIIIKQLKDIAEELRKLNEKRNNNG